MNTVLIFFITHWYLSLFSQSFFDHRYAAHRDFTMNKFWERFFYIFTYITQGASYMSPRAYAIMHRMHHAYTDTENDPHSPRHSKGVIDMMLRTNRIYLGILKGTIVPESQFTKLVPDWPAFDKFAVTYASSIFWTVLYVIFYINYAPNYWWFLLVPIHVLMGPIHGTIINWFAHKYGYKNFEMDNTARNLMPVDIFMLGEGYHNNHHKFSTRANFGYHWYEIDPVYWVILFLNMLGIIQLKKESKAFVENVF